MITQEACPNQTEPHTPAQAPGQTPPPNAVPVAQEVQDLIRAVESARAALKEGQEALARARLEREALEQRLRVQAGAMAERAEPDVTAHLRDAHAAASLRGDRATLMKYLRLRRAAG